jgi:CubicO group peptidase (beta-lactamase class C family)
VAARKSLCWQREASSTAACSRLLSSSSWAGLRSENPISAEPRIDTLGDLERELETLRVNLRIPGMSAAVAENERVVWTQGFGMAASERGVPAGDDTIYHLASLTKPYTSTVLLQLVQEGGLDLEAPVSQFGIAMKRATPVKVWHLLSHTSDEPPGTRYRYDGNAFGRLTQVIERASGRPFAAELASRIIRPLGLTHTAPNPVILMHSAPCLSRST